MYIQIENWFNITLQIPKKNRIEYDPNELFIEKWQKIKIWVETYFLNHYANIYVTSMTYLYYTM